MPKKIVFPKTVGASIDALYLLREKKRVLEAQVAEVQSELTLREEAIFKSFGRQDLDGAKGKVGQCSVVQSVVPIVEDWPKVYAYIRKKKAFDLLEKRMSVTAYRERLEAKINVPGTKPFTKTKLSLTKVKAK